MIKKYISRNKKRISRNKLTQSIKRLFRTYIKKLEKTRTKKELQDTISLPQGKNHQVNDKLTIYS